MNKSILFCSLILLVIKFNRISAQIEPGTFVARPEEIDDVLINPGIGFTTFQRFNGDTLTTLRDNSGWTEG